MNLHCYSAKVAILTTTCKKETSEALEVMVQQKVISGSFHIRFNHIKHFAVHILNILFI